MEEVGAKRKKTTEPSVDDLYRLGKELQNRSGSSIGAFTCEDRRFRSFFGCGASVALVCWNTLSQYGAIPEGGMIIHMLWAMYWMKCYPKQEEASAISGGSGGAIDPKTWKKYYWPFVQAIASVCDDVIVFEHRKLRRKNKSDCNVCVDGVDCRIPNHGPDFASHKFAMKSALRYELGTDIEKGTLCWLHGPFPAGNWPDIKIFRHALKHMLDEGERVEADDGYVGEPMKVKCPSNFSNPIENLKMQSIVRSRHETANGRMKNWEVLNVQYRHDLTGHGTVFRAIAVITQLSIQNGDSLFSVDYE